MASGRGTLLLQMGPFLLGKQAMQGSVPGAVEPAFFVITKQRTFLAFHLCPMAMSLAFLVTGVVHGHSFILFSKALFGKKEWFVLSAAINLWPPMFLL